jgi:hypothetical protein
MLLLFFEGDRDLELVKVTCDFLEDELRVTLPDRNINLCCPLKDSQYPIHAFEKLQSNMIF